MYKIVYCLADGSIASEETDIYDSAAMKGVIDYISHGIETGKVFLLKKRMLTGYSETIIVNAKNITKVECINLDDKVTENN